MSFTEAANPISCNIDVAPPEQQVWTLRQADMLMMQGDTLPIGPYFASYREKVTEGIHVRFQVDYFDRVPRIWKQGEVAYYEGMVFEAKEEHTASDDFENDMERFWTFVPFPNARQARDAVRKKNQPRYFFIYVCLCIHIYT